MKPILAIVLCAVASCSAHVRAESSNLAELEQQALQSAIEAVADYVVQIRTVGGLDRVGSTTIAQGPTTGLVVTDDGYIISSAFNFAQQPSSILVRLPNGTQVPAELVARDKNRMLVLLKVDVEDPLPVPAVTPTDELRVGQWAVALGRTFRSDRVGVSVGILSALDRMYGRVVQTDASVSAANYGGPLVDIHGRVIGVLTPMSPQPSGAQSELAGAEFYDSGIGFAVPLADVLELLPRLQGGSDLLPGKLGIGLKDGSVYVTPPEITSVWRGSPAATAGLQPKDLIIAIDGKQVETQAQLRFALIPHYAGDRLSVTVRRGETEELTESLTLAGELSAYRHSFLGVLPSRNEPNGQEAGINVRATWPDSPAEAAGLKAGDQLIKIADSELSQLNEALAAISGIAPEDQATLFIKRDGKEMTLEAKLTTLPSEILNPDDLPPATEPAEFSDPVQLKPLKVAEMEQLARYYAPQSPKEARGLLLWLSDEKPETDEQLAARWRQACERDGVVLLIAHSQDEATWTLDDLEFLRVLLRTAFLRLDIDPRRAVVCGKGRAGQLAYALAFGPRSSISGVVSLDAPLPRTLKLPPSLPGRRLAVLALETPGSSFTPLVRKNLDELQAAGYRTSWWQRSASDDSLSEFDDSSLEVIARWMDGLDAF